MPIAGWEWIAVITVVVVIILYYLLRSLRPSTPRGLPKEPAPTPTVREERRPVVVKEREVIREREVVKIRCSHCKTLYEESLGRCPNCGAPT